MFQEESARRGHTRQASCSITTRQHDRCNLQCEHITPLVTCEVLSNMLVDHNKAMMSQMQQTMEESIDTVFRKLNISSNSHVAHMNHHSSNSSATHIPLESTQFNMLFTYFPS
jgi:hypothetical protein